MQPQGSRPDLGVRSTSAGFCRTPRRQYSLDGKPRVIAIALRRRNSDVPGICTPGSAQGTRLLVATRHGNQKPKRPSHRKHETVSGRGQVLRVLAEAGRPVSGRTLAVATGLPRAVLAPLLVELQRRGELVVRRQAYLLPGVAEALDAEAEARRAASRERARARPRAKPISFRPAGPPLEWPVADCSLPLAVRRWAERNGVQTVAELIERDPREPRRGGLRADCITRAQLWLLKEAGVRWDPIAPEPIAKHPWDTLIEQLSESVLQGSPFEPHLPGRMVKFCRREAVQTLRELVSIPAASLLAVPNLGSVTVRQAAATILAYERGLKEREASLRRGLLESFEALLATLDARAGRTIRWRAGLACAPSTLEDIAARELVTRERVRQIEQWALGRVLDERRWRAYVDTRLHEAASGGLSRLSDLASDPWWTKAAAAPKVLDYLFRRVFGSRWHIVSLNEELYLCVVSQEALDRVRVELHKRGRAARLPQPVGHFRKIFQLTLFECLGAEPTELGFALGDHLWNEFDAMLTLDRGLREDEEVGRPILE